MITQRKALARMEQQTRIAQRRLEDGYNAMLLKLWKSTLADIRATVLDTYRQDFGRGTWDLVGAQTRGTLSRINDRSAERLLLFKAEATLLIERSLAHIHNQERLRALWMIDQTTPQSFLPKAPPRSVREADNPRDAKATWSVALNAWVDNYQSQLANNLRMEALHEGDIHDAADEPEATRVAGYDPAYKFSSMFAGEAIKEEADARRDIFDGNDDVVEEEIWVTMEDGIVCEICAGYDQKPLSEVEDDIPAHYNCILPGNEVVCPDLVAAAKSFYEGPAVEIVLADGRRLSVTENHPVLTPSGFVAAKFLRKGVHVINAGSGERIAKAINPDYNARPAAIEKVFESFKMSRGVESVRVPISSEDFHGDARHVNGDIDIISSYGLLGSYAKTFFAKPLNKKLLGKIRLPHCLHGQSKFNLLGVCDVASSGGGIRFSNESHPSCSIGLGHTESHGIGAPTDRHPHSNQAIAERRPAHTKRSRYFLERFSTFISTAEIVQINRFNFSGHVYDLQADIFQLYIVNSIVVNNCRCYTRFVPKAWADMMRSGDSDERDAAQAMDDAGLVKDSMAIRSPKTGEIIARAVISFEDWQAERGQNIAGVAGLL